jgi:YD repeat-containing protein
VGKGMEAVYQINNGLVKVVDTHDLTETWKYDELGRQIRHTGGDGAATTYGYDMQGNLIETRQPLGLVSRAVFDAQGRKTMEVDALGSVATWTYDYFGQLLQHTDLAGTGFNYSYDKAGQLLARTSAAQTLGYSYDAAGQVTRITDSATGKVTTTSYDLSGRHVRERVTQGGAVYQDNHLAYDVLGNLRDVADARVHMTLDYDKVGNRTRIATSVDYQGVSGEAASTTVRYFKYNAMNWQTVVDAEDAAGTIGNQRHQIAYDRDGNRTSDTWYGNHIVKSDGGTMIIGYNSADDTVIYAPAPVTFRREDGLTTEQYRYDNLDRLTSVVRDGVQIDVRYYDAADRVVQSGPVTKLPSSNYADLLNDGVAPNDTNGKERR